MSDNRDEQSFDVRGFLERLQRPPRKRGEYDPERPTPREVRVFTASPLAGRLWWLLRRRASSDGRIRAGARATALRQKMEHFPPVHTLAASTSTGPCRWLPIGPRNINGRIKCLAIHPINPSVIYAGSADGGVWKTIDAGQSWAPKMDSLPSMSIGALAIDPQAPDTIYAGTGEALKVAAASGYLWAYEGDGVYRSTDGGDTWAAFGQVPNQFIYRIAVDPNDSNNVFCAGYAASGGGLCRWDQGSASWIVERPGVFTDVLFDPSRPGVVYAGEYQTLGGAGHAPVLKATDGGRTWFPSSTGLPDEDIGRVSLALARAKPEVLYAKIEDTYFGVLWGVYRTGTAAMGTAAAPAWTPCTDPGVDVPDPQANPQLWWCSYIAADPSDASGNTVYASGIDLARSGNGGQSWQRLSRTYQVPSPAQATRPTHADHQDLVFDPTNSARLYIATDGGVFVGEYTGSAPPVDWRKVSTGLAVTQFYDLATSPASPSMLGGGCQDNGTIVSTGGLSWRQVHGGDGSYLAFHSTLPWTMWVQRWDVSRSRLRRSVDGGTTVGGFPDADTGILGGAEMPVTLLAIDRANPAVLFAGTNRVYRTANGDASLANNVVWSAVSPPANSVITEISVAASNLVYAGTMNGRLYRATAFTAAANSFVEVTPQVAGWPTRWLSGVTVVPGAQEVVYVTFLGYSGTGVANQVWRGVFDTATGQFSSMQNISGILPDVPVSALVVDPGAPTILYIATDVGVFRHDGLQWEAFDQGLPRVMVVDLALDPARGLLRAATHGRGAYQRRLTSACRSVDIYLRDNILDTGEVFPSPSGEWDPERPQQLVYHWQSADIKVDAPPFDPVDALLDGVEFDDPAHRPSPVLGYPVEDIPGIAHDNPVRGVVNRVYVQVHNRGWATAASVTAKLLWADASLGLPPLPANFWAGLANDSYAQTDWHLIGNAPISNLEAGIPRVVSFQWTPPASAPVHVCLLAMIDSPQDPLLPETQLNVDSLTRSNKRVTQRNVHTMAAVSSAGIYAGWAVPWFRSAFTDARRFTMRLGAPQPSPWRARLVLPADPDGISLATASEGFEISRPSRAQWQAQIARALAAGAIDDAVAERLDAFPHPLVLTLPSDRRSAEVRGVRLAPQERVPVVLILEAPSGPPSPAPARVDLVQLDEDQRLGGCTFVVRAIESGADPRRLGRAWPP